MNRFQVIGGVAVGAFDETKAGVFGNWIDWKPYGTYLNQRRFCHSQTLPGISKAEKTY